MKKLKCNDNLLESIKKVRDYLDKLEKPKAYILKPTTNGFDVFEIEDGEANLALNIIDSQRKFNETNEFFFGDNN